jgi:hypothetical protein
LAVAQLTLTPRSLAGASVIVNFSVAVPSLGSSADESLIESFELLSSLTIVPTALATTAPVLGFRSCSVSVSLFSSRVSPFTLIVTGKVVGVAALEAGKVSCAPPTSVKSEDVADPATVL